MARLAGNNYLQCPKTNPDIAHTAVKPIANSSAPRDNVNAALVLLDVPVLPAPVPVGLPADDEDVFEPDLEEEVEELEVVTLRLPVDTGSTVASLTGWVSI